MILDPSLGSTCYFFSFSSDLLEIDVLEMDRSLRYALRHIQQGEETTLCIRGFEEKRGRLQVARTAKVVTCTVDHVQGVLTGAGLGEAFGIRPKRSDQTGAGADDGLNEWVIEPLPTNGDSEQNIRRFGISAPRAFLLPEGQFTDSTAAAAPQGEAHQTDHAPPVVLPHAVAIDVSKTLPILRALADMTHIPTSDVHLHLMARRLSMRSGFEELLSLQSLRELTAYPHQIRAAERVLRQMRGRALLCDEVGLGKTIEAGLILSEYRLRGLAKKILILTPPSLVQQWYEEVTRKFGIPFVCYDDARFRSADQPWKTHDHVIASLDTAKREGHREQILEIEYDLVIVDEAHHLKNRATVAWKFVGQLKKKYILLLTATPIENHMGELFNLITLLKPGQLLTESEFKRRFVDSHNPLAPKNVQELRKLMQSVMIRNRRSTTGVIQSARTAETFVLTPDPLEGEFYTRLSQFVKVQLQQPTTGRGAMGQAFILRNILRQAGSSVSCTLPTLEKLAQAHRNEQTEAPEKLLELIAAGHRIRASAKLEALRKLLIQVHDQTVVFTGYVETQQAITSYLLQQGVDVVTFHGGMSRAQKEEAITRFREGVPVLVSTESGGEGRNLQFCHRIVNFDIPWNPMRIEQRIGRIHRIGQEHEVNIYNLAAKGTMEEHILSILDAKINLFQLVVGELDMILGALDQRREFEDLLMDIWLASKSEEELVQGVDALGDELLAARTHYQKVRDVDDQLLSELMQDA